MQECIVRADQSRIDVENQTLTDFKPNVQYLPENGMQLDELRKYIENTFDETLMGQTVRSDAIETVIN
jgi:hypothetical protein